MSDTVEVKVPDVGDFDSVEVIEVLVEPGARVQAEDSLITLESDKATMEIPSPAAGTVESLAVGVGDKVAEGSLILTLRQEDAGGAAPAAAAASAETEAGGSEPGAEATRGAGAAAAPETGAGGQAGDQGEAAAPAATAPAADASESASESGEPRPVQVPDIGDFEQVEVIEILVAAGDEVAAETSLVTLESDKATMEIPSPAAGRVQEVAVKLGDHVSEGDLLLTLAGSGARAEAAAAGETEAAPHPPTEQQPAVLANEPPEVPQPSVPGAGSADAARPMSRTAYASPSVRRFARQLGVDLEAVTGTGRKGRILEADLKAHVKQAMSAPGAPAAATAGGGALPALPGAGEDFSRFGEIEQVQLSRIQRHAARNLHASWVNLPHVTQFDEADITELEAFRKRQRDELAEQEVKLTLVAFLVKACARALAEFPHFNASLAADGETLILKRYCHIGVAVDTPDGLLVPVVRDADKTGVTAIAAEVQRLSEKARAKRLSPEEMQGGCFTITSLGGVGGTAFTPIINPPEVAILGVSRAATKPVWMDGAFLPRLLLPLSLSYDHRVIDGVAGARFTGYLARVLADLRLLVM